MAMIFDGVNQYLTAPDSVSLSPTGKALSLSTWFLTPVSWSLSPEIIIGKPINATHTAPYWCYSLHTVPLDDVTPPSDCMRFFVATGTGALDSKVAKWASRLALNTWYHVCGMYDGTNIKLYMDGVERASTANTANLQDSAQALRMGSNITPGEYLKGSLDDLRIYDRVLTANEFQTLLALKGNDNIIQNLVARYNLNEQTPGATASGSGTVRDSSGYANHATAFNSPVYTESRLRFGRRGQLS